MKNTYTQSTFNLGLPSVVARHEVPKQSSSYHARNWIASLPPTLRASGDKRSQRQTGFSIVEALVGILISTILLAGVLQIFLNSKRINAMESNVADMQDSARFAIGYMSRVIRLGGYRTPPASGSDYSNLTSVFPAGATFISGSNGSSSNSDTLIVRYQGSGNGSGTADGTIRDCLNNGVDSNTTVTNTFSINTTTNELQCRAQNANAATPDNTLSLIPGVENMQVLYGEDVDADGTADRYVPASFSGLDMNRVVSVRVSLLLRSNDTLRLNPTSVTYNVNNQAITPSNANYLRYQVTFTTALRNVTSKSF